MYKFAMTHAARPEVACLGKLYGHDAKEDDNYDPESELRGWKVHLRLFLLGVCTGEDVAGI
jgi:hypothetical protein